MRHKPIKAAARLQSSGWGTAARLTRAPLRLIILRYVYFGGGGSCARQSGSFCLLQKIFSLLVLTLYVNIPLI